MVERQLFAVSGVCKFGSDRLRSARASPKRAFVHGAGNGVSGHTSTYSVTFMNDPFRGSGGAIGSGGSPLGSHGALHHSAVWGCKSLCGLALCDAWPTPNFRMANPKKAMERTANTDPI